ncbi:hypothetical protein Pdw03_7475 [Penicillium digitatum]|uniref:Uncharacterized protein n=1 Tax=Penicillium digitatum TaxID=36651 RepID=A0A7T6XLZ8_PENDI|nr:hypothetical protein Pdw03_7475 [Penicillium digitatum]
MLSKTQENQPAFPYTSTTIIHFPPSSPQLDAIIFICLPLSDTEILQRRPSLPNNPCSQAVSHSICQLLNPNFTEVDPNTSPPPSWLC